MPKRLKYYLNRVRKLAPGSSDKDLDPGSDQGLRNEEGTTVTNPLTFDDVYTRYAGSYPPEISLAPIHSPSASRWSGPPRDFELIRPSLAFHEDDQQPPASRWSGRPTDFELMPPFLEFPEDGHTSILQCSLCTRGFTDAYNLRSHLCTYKKKNNRRQWAAFEE